MHGLDSSSSNSVKRSTHTVSNQLYAISVDVELVDWPGGRLAVIQRGLDDGEFRIALNARHPHVQAWLQAENRRAKARALARLLKLMARNLRAVGGVNPFEYLAIKKSIELYE